MFKEFFKGIAVPAIKVFAIIGILAAMEILGSKLADDIRSHPVKTQAVQQTEALKRIAAALEQCQKDH